MLQLSTTPTRRKRVSIRKQRHLLETTIERLVELLDFLDGDPDLEANGDDEPSLGWTEMEARWDHHHQLACSDWRKSGKRD